MVATAAGVDLHQLSEEGVGILRPVPGVVGRSAVAEAEPEGVVVGHHHVPAVVVGEGLLHREELLARRMVDRAVVVHVVRRDLRGAVEVRVAHVEDGPVVGERHAQQAALHVGGGLVTDVERGVAHR